MDDFLKESNLKKNKISPLSEIVEISSVPSYYNGITPPICLTSIFQQKSVNNPRRSQFLYSRMDNPNNVIAEKQIAALYEMDNCIAFPSGMAALNALIFSNMLKNAESEKEVEGEKKEGEVTRNMLISDEIYPIESFFEQIEKLGKVKTIRFDVRSIEDLKSKMKRGTELVYIESCSNPGMKIGDFETTFEIVKKVNPKCEIIVDNTWMSAVNFNPFKLKIQPDYVFESGSKFLTGTSSIVYGFVICKEKKNEYNLKGYRNMNGFSVCPVSSYVVSLGISTIKLRMNHLNDIGLELCKFLEEFRCVSKVIYPSLENHPDHELCRKYFNGRGGGIVYFHLPLLDDFVALQITKHTKLIIPSTSYGSSHFLWDHYSKGGNSNKYDKRDKKKISGTWYRLALGYSTEIEDIKMDLLRVFSKFCVLKVGTVKNIDRNVISFNKFSSSELFKTSKEEMEENLFKKCLYREMKLIIRKNEFRERNFKSKFNELKENDIVVFTNKERTNFFTMKYRKSNQGKQGNSIIMDCDFEIIRMKRLYEVFKFRHKDLSKN